jgi:phosphonate C-P lyase system protein PhnH
MSLDVTAARLDADAALGVFRVLLDALSHPGRTFSLGDEWVVASAAVGALALADVDVVCSVVGPATSARGLGECIARATGARPTGNIEDADMVVATIGTTAAQLHGIRTGTAADPELGAKLFLGCDSIVAGPADLCDSTSVNVAGPGASHGRSFVVAGVDDGVLDLLVGLNAAFPAGVDTWLISSTGMVVGVPRSSTIVTTAGSR